jgi:ADP-heptose:LPS heptosyltransferase
MTAQPKLTRKYVPLFKILLIALSAAFLAKIPVRIGRASNVWQFFLNKPVYQGRSKNEKHEYEYNLDLLNGFDTFTPIPKVFPRLRLTHKAFTIAETMIPFRSFVIVHPGHGGSAYNLSIRKYVEIAEKLARSGINIIVTAGPEEKNVIEAFKKLSEYENIRILSSIPDLEQLSGVISRAKALICGSTGPLHIAAALNVPTVAFFPPVPAMTPVRWGPTGNSSLILLPGNAKCNRNSNCKSCLYAPCMEKIQIEKAIDWIKLSVSQ